MTTWKKLMWNNLKAAKLCLQIPIQGLLFNSIISKTIRRNRRHTCTQVLIRALFIIGKYLPQNWKPASLWNVSICLALRQRGPPVLRDWNTNLWLITVSRVGGAWKCMTVLSWGCFKANILRDPTSHEKQMLTYLFIPVGKLQVTFTSGRPRFKSRGLFRLS